MTKEIPIEKDFLESFSSEKEESKISIDEDYFKDLCFEEIEYLCESVRLNRLNKMLILLHCKGLSDAEIENRIAKWLPALSTKKKLTANAIKQRRHSVIKKIEKEVGSDVGLITLLRECFGG